MISNQFSANLWLIGMRLKTALTATIYTKSLKLTSSERANLSAGETLNLVQIDTHKIQELINNLHTAWTSPIQIALSFYFLWGILGAASLAGVGVIVAIILINTFLSKKMRKYQFDNMAKKDQRIKMMNEILEGIKVLKLYAWEPSFRQHITHIREEEVDSLKKLSFYHAIQQFVFWSASFLVALAAFATFIYSDPANILDAQTAWVSISYFNIMHAPLINLPKLVLQYIQVRLHR